MRNPKIFKLFLNVHMGASHQGLSLLAAKQKIKLMELDSDDLLMFLNRKGDKLKVLGAQGRVIGYLKMPNGHLIMKEALLFIPQTFGAKGFDYESACKVALEARMGYKV